MNKTNSTGGLDVVLTLFETSNYIFLPFRENVMHFKPWVMVFPNKVSNDVEIFSTKKS